MGSPNFEQIPINRPHNGVHNNNRDGAGQQMINTNNAPYSENTLNGGAPYHANFTQGKGFFTAPARTVVDAHYVREISPTFLDYWTQPRLFWNSLEPSEQQMVVNAMRFELSHCKSATVKKNALVQINRISNNLAKRVAEGIGLHAPAPDAKYYHNNKTEGVSIIGSGPLPTIATLKVAILTTTTSNRSLDQARALAAAFKAKGVKADIIAETFVDGVTVTYTGADAVLFDGIIAADGTKDLFYTKSTLFPTGRPAQIIKDGFNYGKPVGALGSGKAGFNAEILKGKHKGVYIYDQVEVDSYVSQFEEGLKTFKFVGRFPIDA